MDKDRRTDQVLLRLFRLSSADKYHKKKSVTLAVEKLYEFLLSSYERDKYPIRFMQAAKHQPFSYMDMGRTESINQRVPNCISLIREVVNIYNPQEFPFVFCIEFKVGSNNTSFFASFTNASSLF